jgi:superfamily II DNA or RNA helicase
MLKFADLLPSVKLQEHQERLSDESKDEPLRKLLIHALGSGKTLTSLAAAEARGEPYTAVTPASLRPNYQKEQRKFTDMKLPSQLMSYNELGKGKPTENTGTVIFDEAQRIRNPESLQAQQAIKLSERAQQLLLLSGTPIVNRPGDLAVPVQMLTGKKFTPAEFERRYSTDKTVYPSWWKHLLGIGGHQEPAVAHEGELRALLKGHVDYYDPGKTVVPVNHEDIHTTMGVEQSRLYKAMWDQLPFWLRWKLKHDYPLTNDELMRMRSFMTGPRQVGLSTYTFRRDGDSLKAFDQSPKLQEAHSRMMNTLKDPRTKALIFSNFIDAGLRPYSAALERAKIPNAIFHGGLNDASRKKLVEDFNNNKIRVALLGPSGTEGLSFKGTQLVQLLDSDWQPVRPKQSIGRGLRFDSHTGLPPELQNVKVERYFSRLPHGFKDKLLSTIGFNRESNTYASDDYLRQIEDRKNKRNQVFYDLLKSVGSERN